MRNLISFSVSAVCLLATATAAHAQGLGGLFRLLDADGNGEISAAELADAPRVLATLDSNQDGRLDANELAAASRPGRTGRPGEIITPAARSERINDKLVVGDEAPDFTLPFVSGKEKFTLSSFRDKRPVVLIFASYT